MPTRATRCPTTCCGSGWGNRFFSQLMGAWVRLCGARARAKAKASASGGGRRCKGISSAAWFRVLLQHAGAVHPGSTQTRSARTKSPCSDVLRGMAFFASAGVAFSLPEPASTKPRTFSWRKTRWCGDRAQAGHGWPVLACWSQGWRNQAMRTIPAPPRLPPKATSPGALAQARSPHHRNAARSQWTPALFSLTGSASLTGEEPYSRPSWWARHSWVHTASMRFSTFGSRVIGRPHSRADSAGHLRVASRPSLEPRPDTGVAKSR